MGIELATCGLEGGLSNHLVVAFGGSYGKEDRVTEEVTPTLSTERERQTDRQTERERENKWSVRYMVMRLHREGNIFK